MTLDCRYIIEAWTNWYEIVEAIAYVTTYGANLFPNKYPYRGMYISGLTLRGASWETKKKKKGLGAPVLLHETIPCAGKLVRLGANTFHEDDLRSDLPTLYMELCENVENGDDEGDKDLSEMKKETKKEVTKNQYECPVFSVDGSRSVISVLLTAPDPQDEWIQGGVHAVL